jgi:hypothetical protein
MVLLQYPMTDLIFYSALIQTRVLSTRQFCRWALTYCILVLRSHSLVSYEVTVLKQQQLLVFSTMRTFTWKLQWMHTLCAFSKGSAPLISIPLRAPTPVPTMTAVGVASPSAQGHAIASTLRAHLNAYWKIISSRLNPIFSSSCQHCILRNLTRRCHKLYGNTYYSQPNSSQS